MVNGELQGQYDITAGDYVTYIEDQLGIGAPKADLRIIAEASFLQPNALTVLVKGRSQISQVRQLKGKVVSVNAPNDIGTLLIDSLLVAHGLTPRQVHYASVPFPAVAPTLTTPHSAVVASFAPEPFVSFGEAQKGLQELADLDQGATQNFPIQGYAVTAEWAKKYPEITPTAPRWKRSSRSTCKSTSSRRHRSAPGVPAWRRRGAAPARGEFHEAVRPAAQEHQIPDHQHDRLVHLLFDPPENQSAAGAGPADGAAGRALLRLVRPPAPLASSAPRRTM